MDVRRVIKQRLEELGLDQRDLAAAARVTESYISQLLTQKKMPPSAERTDMYERMDAFLKLPKGQLSAMVEAQRKEELKKKLGDPPAPLFKEVRELVIQKCKKERQGEVRGVFEKQAFGEAERLITQTLLDVTQRIAAEEVKNEKWLRALENFNRIPHAQMRGIILEFLNTDVLDISPGHCTSLLEPLIDSWDIDFATFEMEIAPNRRFAAEGVIRLQFMEIDSEQPEEEPGFLEFIGDAAMSRDATEEEIAFLKSLRFKQKRPNALYYYRELQNIRDPLHFQSSETASLQRRGDSSNTKKRKQLESRKRAIRGWATNKSKPREER